MKSLPKRDRKLMEGLTNYFLQMERVYNTILENQEEFVKGHNEHDERLDKIEVILK